MNCDDIKLMISEYIDNELTKEKEAFLFTHLSSCTDCREEFKMQNSIQHEVKINLKNVGERFEQKVFDSIQKKEQPLIKRWITKPTPAYINYVLGFAIIMITLFSFLQFSSFKDDLNNYQESYMKSVVEINSKTNQINFLMNSLPTATVTKKIENLVVVKAKI